MTLTYKCVDFDVKYKYFPGEKPVCNYGDGSGYPGANEEVDIIDISYCGTSFLSVLEDNMPEIECLILEKIHAGD